MLMCSARRPLSSLRVLTCVLAVLLGCATPGPTAVADTGHGRQPAADADADFAEHIDSPAMWQSLAARPGSEHIANTEVVKVILDGSDGRIYFLQSRRWPIHYYFAQKFLSTSEHPVGDETAFNRTEYHSEQRRFVLGALSHFRDADVWTFELYAGDTLDLDTTSRAFRALRKRLYFGDRLRYRPVPLHHERDIEQVRQLMPVVTTDEIFGKLRYQALELGEAYGYVRVVGP